MSVASVERTSAVSTADQLCALIKQLDLAQFSNDQQLAIKTLLTEHYAGFSINDEMGTAHLPAIHIEFEMSNVGQSFADTCTLS